MDRYEFELYVASCRGWDVGFTPSCPRPGSGKLLTGSTGNATWKLGPDIESVR